MGRSLSVSAEKRAKIASAPSSSMRRETETYFFYLLLRADDMFLLRPREGLQKDASRSAADAVCSDAHAERDRRGTLFAVKEVGGKVLRDLPRNEGARPHKGEFFAVVTHDGERSRPTDTAAHVQLSVCPRGKHDVRVLDEAAHI